MVEPGNEAGVWVGVVHFGAPNWLEPPGDTERDVTFESVVVEAHGVDVTDSHLVTFRPNLDETPPMLGAYLDDRASAEELFDVHDAATLPAVAPLDPDLHYAVFVTVNRPAGAATRHANISVKAVEYRWNGIEGELPVHLQTFLTFDIEPLDGNPVDCGPAWQAARESLL